MEENPGTAQITLADDQLQASAAALDAIDVQDSHYPAVLDAPVGR
jgi:hypothetical protein